MRSKPHVLLASRSKRALKELVSKLASNKRFKFDTRLIENGHADPLFGLSYEPDIVVMTLNNKGHDDLTALIDEHSPDRPPMIVLAEGGDAQTMRLAMQAGARDFLPGVVSSEDLVGSLERVASQVSKSSGERDTHLTAFVNAKGGSGATFLACNVAHILKSASDHSTALVSLDMQFESLAQYFDLKLKHGLLEVLDHVDSLDSIALDAYMTRHESGLRMLAAKPENVIECHLDKAKQLGQLVDKMARQYDHVIVDMPRRIDPYMVPVLERATRLVLVVQQTLSHLRDASRMQQIFANYGISTDQILVVINRFDKNAPIDLEDVKRSLQGCDFMVVPSDFRTVAESINLGIPIYQHARGSAVTKALVALETKLGGGVTKASSGFFDKAFSNLLRKEAWFRT